MKKVLILNTKTNHSYGLQAEDPSEWIAKGIEGNWWGKPERLVPHKDAPGAESYAEEDVLEEKIVIDDLGVEKKFVKLKAEYTIEIEDISSQYALEQVIMKRKLEYPSPEEFLDAMFDGGGEAIEKLKQRRLAIKAKYPKPGA